MSTRRSRRSNRAAEPERTCIGCGRVTGQSDLVRVARYGGGPLQVGRHEPGRGAWLCAGSPPCLDEALRRGAFRRALGVEVREGDLEGLRAKLCVNP